MNCPECDSAKSKKHGKDRKGNQRYRCLACSRTFQELEENPLGTMTLPMDKVLLIVRLMVEGNSIRSIERITGVHRDTVLSLLETVGEKCANLLTDRIKGLPVKDVQCDEIWGFVGMKEKTKHSLAIEGNSELGDAYCFIAIEQNTKVILAWHLGRRTVQDTIAFTEKIDHATTGNFQINTDGFNAYWDAIVRTLGTRVDFAQIIKVFGKPEGDDHRYSFPEVIGVEKTALHGRPDLEKATTSHIERQNLNVRMGMRRMTRLTNGFSKKWLNLYYAYAINFAYHNFCRVHTTLRVTPAMEANITDHVWSIEELLSA